MLCVMSVHWNDAAESWYVGFISRRVRGARKMTDPGLVDTVSMLQLHPYCTDSILMHTSGGVLNFVSVNVSGEIASNSHLEKAA